MSYQHEIPIPHPHKRFGRRAIVPLFLTLLLMLGASPADAQQYPNDIDQTEIDIYVDCGDAGPEIVVDVPGFGEPAPPLPDDEWVRIWVRDPDTNQFIALGNKIYAHEQYTFNGYGQGLEPGELFRVHVDFRGRDRILDSEIPAPDCNEPPPVAVQAFPRCGTQGPEIMVTMVYPGEYDARVVVSDDSGEIDDFDFIGVSGPVDYTVPNLNGDESYTVEVFIDGSLAFEQTLTMNPMCPEPEQFAATAICIEGAWRLDYLNASATVGAFDIVIEAADGTVLDQIHDLLEPLAATEWIGIVDSDYGEVTIKVFLGVQIDPYPFAEDLVFEETITLRNDCPPPLVTVDFQPACFGLTGIFLELRNVDTEERLLEITAAGNRTLVTLAPSPVGSGFFATTPPGALDHVTILGATLDNDGEVRYTDVIFDDIFAVECLGQPT